LALALALYSVALLTFLILQCILAMITNNNPSIHQLQQNGGRC